MTAVITITSGKAKVGKSILSANLAQYLNQKGHRTGLLMAGARQPVWGIEPNTTWPNILTGRLPMDKAIHRDVFGIDLMVTQGHGHALQGLTVHAANHLEDPLGILDAYAYLIVDISAGISAPALACCLAATESIMVLTPDAPTIAAAYEWLVHLTRHGFSGPINLIMNQVRKPALVQSIFLRFRDLAQKRLKIQTNLWGAMSREENIDPTVARQHPLSQTMPHSKLWRDIQAIGDRLVAEQPAENQTRPLKAFWQDFIDHLQQLPAMPVAAIDQPREPVEPEPYVLTQPASSESPPTIVNDPPVEEKTDVLTHLSTQLTAIAQELNAIRRLLEIHPLGGRGASPEQNEALSGSIDLDFDAFVDRHKMTEER
jgi:MinD-like ATPase involved in chromosome partitioning or flagellar assembly